MRVRLDYGTEGLEVDLPDERVTSSSRCPRAAVADPHATLLSAIRAPLDRPRLGELVRTGQRVAISVCDITRAQPRREMLRALFEEMPQVRPEDVTILIATGTHRINTPPELERMLGRDILNRIPGHQPRFAGSLVAGTRGRDVHGSRGLPEHGVARRRRAYHDGLRRTAFLRRIQRRAEDDGSWAGGLEDGDDAARRPSHRPPLATWGVTEGNPVHDDVREIARMVPVHFAVDVTLNREQQITAAFAGDILTEHRAACAHAKATAMRQVPTPFDLVLTTNSGYPLDQNLYQAVKGMSAAAKIVKTGGTIICAAECRDGLPSHGSYGAVLASAPSPAALLEMISSPGYSVPDQWQVQVQAQIQTKAQVMVKTDGLRPDEIRAAHFTPIDDIASSVQDTLRQAVRGDAVRAAARAADDSVLARLRSAAAIRRLIPVTTTSPALLEVHRSLTHRS
jgi:nickel-dependent lactate racemase